MLRLFGRRHSNYLKMAQEVLAQFEDMQSSLIATDGAPLVAIS
jgi:hypothetical protein